LSSSNLRGAAPYAGNSRINALRVAKSTCCGRYYRPLQLLIVSAFTVFITKDGDELMPKT
jgi:hypothetical protein